MFFRFLSAPFFLLVAYSAQAIMITDNRGQVEAALPQGWSYEKNLFGLPHVFLSPEGADRASFSLTLTGIGDVKLPVKDLKKNQGQYQEGRKKWAQTRDFIITKFIPYNTFNSDKVPTHAIGFQYKDKKNVEYVEMSYFTECQDSLVHTKAVGILDSEKMKAALKIIDSLRCLKK